MARMLNRAVGNIASTMSPGIIVPLDEAMLHVFELQSKGVDDDEIISSTVENFKMSLDEARDINALMKEEYNPKSWRLLKGKTAFQPTYAELCLTWKCNLRCNHCYVFNMNNEVASKEEMSTEQWKNILTQLKQDLDVPAIAFIGGEPLLRDGIEDLVDFSLHSGFDSVGVASNGTASLISERLIHLMSKESGRTFFQISIEGAKPETHESTRGKGSFSSTVEGIRKLVGGGIRVGLSEVVTKANYHESQELIKLAVELGVRSLTFNSLRPAGKGADVWNEDVSPYEWKKLVEYLLSMRKQLEGQLRIEFDTRFAYENLFAELGPETFPEVLKNSNLVGCESKRTLYITPDGFAVPCSCLTLDRRFYSKESLRTAKLLDIWENDPNVTLFRRIEKEGIKGACQTCEYYRICQGGCHYISYFVHGDFALPDPRCSHATKDVQ